MPTIEAGVPHVDVPAIETPEVELPTVEAHVEAPEVELPEVELPKVEAPEVELPKVELPEVEAPEVELSEVEVPEVELPEVEAPEVELPKVELPEVELPSRTAGGRTPEVELRGQVPEVEVPESKRQLNCRRSKRRKLNPEVELPDRSAGSAAAQVEIDAPVKKHLRRRNRLPTCRPPCRGILRYRDTELPAVTLPPMPDAAAVAGAEAESEAARLRAQVAELEARLAALRQAEAADADAPIEAGVSGKLPGADEAARIAAEMRAAGLLSHPDEGSTPAAPTTPAPQADNLLLIQGIGPYYAQRLKEIGIVTFLQLAEASDETLARVTGTFSDRVKREDWRGQARRMAEGK